MTQKKDYPRRPELVKSATGKSLDDISLAKVVAENIGFDDKISAETLKYQARIGESIHRPNIAANLRRPTELTGVPDERILGMYNVLCP